MKCIDCKDFNVTMAVKDREYGRCQSRKSQNYGKAVDSKTDCKEGKKK